MKRIVIFAHYDKHNLIDDYVLYYLKQLKNYFEKIIFVSDCNLEEAEKEKIKPFVDYIQAYKHGEYDWGSYKYGFKIAKENNLLANTDEVLLCNDSVYGPICSLEELFNTFSQDNCDFWGLYENKYGLDDKIEPHLQSWFLLLKKNVFLSKEFDKFIMSVKEEENKLDIIRKYEIGFTQEMKKHFSYKSAFTSEKTNAVVIASTLLLSLGFPFIKAVVFKKYQLDFNKYVDKTLLKIIKTHSKRVNKEQKIVKLIRTFKIKSKMKKYNIIKNY